LDRGGEKYPTPGPVDLADRIEMTTVRLIEDFYADIGMLANILRKIPDFWKVSVKDI
jgi:hypothetical protein